MEPFTSVESAPSVPVELFVECCFEEICNGEHVCHLQLETFYTRLSTTGVNSVWEGINVEPL